MKKYLLKRKPSNKYKLNQNVRPQILELMRILRIGKDNSIKAPDLEILLDIEANPKSHNYQVRLLIKDAVVNYGFLIGGCSKGFYLIKTQEEYEEVQAALYAHVSGTMKRINALKRSWYRDY